MTPRQRWTLVATVIGSGSVFLDGTVVNLALPSIGRELPSTLFGVLEGQTYVVSGYLAILAALLIIAGALSDHYGRRRVYAIGLASFAGASVLCGLAPTLEWLVVFRLLQGAAGALLIPGALSIISQTFDAGPERGRAFGIWAAATSGLVLLGPLVGGLIVDGVGWRFAFLINVPVLAFALWVTLRHVAEFTGYRGAPLRLARLGRGRPRGRRAVVRADPRRRARMAGPHRLGLDRDRGRVPRGIPDAHGEAQGSARATLAVPVAGLRVDQSRHVLHLWRAVRHAELSGHPAAERAGLHGPWRGCGDPPDGLVPDAPVDPHRRSGRTARRAALPGRRPAAHRRRPALVHAPAGRLRAVAGVAIGPGQPDPTGRRARRRPAVHPAHRRRYGLRRRAADDDAHGLRPRTLLGSRLGHQQRHRASRAAAPRRGDLRRDQRHVLFQPRDARARARRRLGAGALGVFATQPAQGHADGRGSGRGRSGIHRGVPPGDVRRGGALRGRLGRVVVRPARRSDAARQGRRSGRGAGGAA